MKRYIYFSVVFALFCVFSVACYAQAKYTIEFDKSDFSFETHNGMLCISSVKPGGIFSEEHETPEVPYFGYRILRPEGTLSVKYDVDIERTLLYEDVTLSGTPFAYSTDTTYVCKPLASSKSVLSPVTLSGVNSRYGYNYAYFRVTPFVYDASTRSLYFVHKVTISISEDEIEGVPGHPRADMRATMAAMVVNPEEMESMYPKAALARSVMRSKKFNAKSQNGEYDYLILCSDQTYWPFLRLQEWKNRKGVRTRVVSKTLLNSYRPDTSEPLDLKIKSFIKQQYDDYHIKYVLLGGDDSVIPTKDCHIDYATGDTEIDMPLVTTHDVVPCDLFYACFGGAFDWDGNGNGKYGEPNDNIDLTPDVILTRVPVSGYNEAQNFVDKVLRYEKGQVSYSHGSKIFFCGTKFLANYYDPSVGDSVCDAQFFSESIFKNYIKAYSPAATHSYAYDGHSTVPGYDNLTYSCFNNQVNFGYNLMSIMTHGSQYQFCFYDGDYGLLTNYTNSDPTVFVSQACQTNTMYSLNTTISKRMLCRPNFGVASFGSSGVSLVLYTKSGILGLSSLYNANFFGNLFRGYPAESPYSFGAVATKTKLDLVDNASTDVNYRYLHLSINPFGDPEMPVYTSNLKVFGNVTASNLNRALTVNTGGVDSCRITVSSLDLSSVDIAGNTSSHTFSDVKSPCIVTVTKHNYKPYVSDTLHVFGNIVGRQFLTGDDTFYVDGVGDDYEVEWLFDNKPELNSLILSDSPLKNQCRIVTGGVQFEGALKANIKWNGNVVGHSTIYVRTRSYVYGTYSQTIGSVPTGELTFADNDTITINPAYDVRINSNFFYIPIITYSFDGVTPTMVREDSKTLILTYPSDTSGLASTFIGTCSTYEYLCFELYINCSPSFGQGQQLVIRKDGDMQSVILQDGDSHEVADGWELDVTNTTTGQVVFSDKGVGTGCQFSTRRWAPGLYAVRVRTKNGISSQKLIIR